MHWIHTVASDNIEVGKPDKAGVLHAVQSLNFTPNLR
jgi:hypothetical protein